jgi:hypothetical protein
VLTGALGAALGGATGAGSTYAGLAEAAVMEAGAIGGSSERSWRESSGSGLSSNAATESVGAIGAGAGATSDWSEIADVDGVAIDDCSADGSRRDSEPVLAVDGVADFAHRPDVDTVPVAVGAAEGATPVGATDAGAADVGEADTAADVGVGEGAAADPVGTLDPGEAADVGLAPDAGWAATAGELPGFAGRGGGFAAGGGEAAGAGRAGGIVGIADLGTGFAAVAERVAVADPVGGTVGDAADGAEGRLASADVADVGFAEPAGRVADAVGAAELAARVGAVAAGADPDPDGEPDGEPDADTGADPGADPDASAGTDPDADADSCPDADLDVVDAGPVEADPDAVFDARGCTDVGPVGIALAFAGAADVRGAAPAGGVCATADFDAGADVFEAGGVASDDEAAARGDFREPEVDVDDVADVGVAGAFAVEADAGVDAALGAGVAGAAERVGGTGESPDPRSETSSTGEAQVPE